MSQHIVEQNEKKYVFGWDPPLQTFFLQVHDTIRDPDNQITLWLGSTPNSTMDEVEELVQEAQLAGLLIDHQTRGQLQEEKLHGERENGDGR